MNTNEVKESLETASKNIEDIKVPDGYLTYRFSTKGKFGAPPVVHVRNFSTEEVLSLSLTDQEDLPAKVGQLIQEVLLEKQETDVLQWHENEVVELLVFMYKSFYGTSLKEVQYTLDDEDFEFMQVVHDGKNEEYLEWERDVNNGRQKYYFDINLDEQVDFYPVDIEKQYELKVKKPNGFTATFAWPRYGDAVVLLQSLKEIYGEKDKEYENDYKTYKFRQQAEQKFLAGENINLKSVPSLSADREKAIKAYELEKSQFLTTLTKALHVVSVNGEDVRDLPLSEKVAKVTTAELDFATYQKVSDAFLSIKIGVIPDIKIKSPITAQEKEYHYPFRVFDILSAIKNYSDNGTTVEFV